MRLVNGGTRQLLAVALCGLIAPWMALADSSDKEIPDRASRVAQNRHAPAIIRERHGRNATSSNWSGYAVTGANGSVSDVKGSWQVPAIQGACPSATQYASFWVGIDGYDTNTVEQIGTDSDCQNGSPVYYAWYEFFPHFAYNIPIAIHVNDVMSAEVSYAGGKFTVFIKDVTTGQSWSTSQKMSNAKRASAEWIIEASGGQPLANFDIVDFGLDNTGVAHTCEATVGGGQSTPIGSFASSLVVEITMVASNGTVMSQPRGLSADGTSFTDTWQNAGP